MAAALRVKEGEEEGQESLRIQDRFMTSVGAATPDSYVLSEVSSVVSHLLV